jgi:YesN/AraC family two-component response regulator
MARILIIDDEEQVRRFLRKILESEDHEVIDAPDGKIGLRLYHKEPADLIITDIFMPEKEGIETIMELKRNFPAVKIIAISGGGHQMAPEDCLRLAEGLGVDYTLSKPFTRQQMLDVVQKALNL